MRYRRTCAVFYVYGPYFMGIENMCLRQYAEMKSPHEHAQKKKNRGKYSRMESTHVLKSSAITIII